MKKITTVIIVSIVFLVFAIIFIVAIVQPGQPQWQKDLDYKASAMSDGQLLRFIQYMYADRDMHDYYNYLSDRFHVDCDYTDDSESIFCGFVE